ncbi:MAG TPA: flavin reductase family protein [Gemmataceae bacterium]|nr:flavin reductase family protein [Gemmataceae bacterium]
MDEARRELAAVLGRIPSGLFILSVRQGQAETGMLTSWVQQCGFAPPLISVALQRDRPIIAWLTQGAAFTLNILDDGQTDMVAHFGRGFTLEESAFAGLDIERPPTGGPVLRKALAYLECRVTSRCPAGDHELLLAEVLAGRVLNEGQPMVHIRRTGFHY